jgi:hypothetical protein
MGGNSCHEGLIARSIRVENETEELIVQRALETYRALQHAVKTAPHVKGLVTVEAVVRDEGVDQLRGMYEAALREHPEAQKGGLLPELFLRPAQFLPLCQFQAPDHGRRWLEHHPPILRLPALHGEADAGMPGRGSTRFR